MVQRYRDSVTSFEMATPRERFQNRKSSVNVLFMSRRSKQQAKIDRIAWPVEVRIRIPDEGFHSWGRKDDPFDWLRMEFGLTEYATMPHDNAYSGEAIAIGFRSLEDAHRFMERFPFAELADGTLSPIYSSPHLPFGRKGD